MNKFAAVTSIALVANAYITHRRITDLTKNLRKAAPAEKKAVDLDEAIRDVQRLTKVFSD